ncbi:MAG: carboxypeptidase-like regulatory domain-containing protein [Acidobacteriota bacterium]|nr:carboxypeptidase-like regulatory domain-containing protein [Acidobacteriota bacterium]
MVNLFALTLAMLLPLTARPVVAQTTTGSIRGTVVDANGAPVVDATVTARNQGTNVENTFKTTGEGIYDISGLPVGRYTVTVESAGFSRAVTTDVNVSLGQVTTVDVALQPGAVTETVTVVAGTEEIVQREQSQISATFETRKVEELPSNASGSGLDTLALLAPGIIPSGGFGGTNTNGTGLSVNGNRPRSNNFQIDGSDNNDLSIGGPSYFVGNQDQVAEYQIITNNFSAQYGRNQGAVVNIVTKSGTNDFHGTGFIFHRDQRALDTLTNLERASGLDEAPRLLSNVYGGTFGGPIVKDRAFFFGSYQGIKQRSEFIFRANTLAILPEELPRLASLYPGNPAIQTIATTSAFALSGAGPVRARTDAPFNVTDQICLPAASGGGENCFNAAFPERTIPSPFDQDEFSIRGDVRLTDRDNIYVRYLDQRQNNKNLAAFFLLEPTGGFNGDLPGFTKNLGGTYTRQFGSSVVNEFKATWQNFGFFFGGGCTATDPGCIPDPAELPNAFSEIAFPAGSITGEETGATLQAISGGSGIGLPQGRESSVYQFADTVTLTRGAHTIITGAEVKYLKNTAPFLPAFQGSFRFASTGGVSAAQRLVNNSAQRLTLAVGNPIIDYTEWDQYYFIQDDWKIRDNLTLNLGLRYEYTGQPINDLNDLTVERESGPNPLFNPALPLEARVVPRVPPDKNNFAPRLGFAWSPRWGGGEGAFNRFLFGDTDATVIRGGFSIAYDPAFYNILLNVSNSAPVSALLVADNLPGGAAAPGRIGFINDATATNVQNAAAAAGVLPIGRLDPRFLNQTGVGSDFHSPYSMQFSLGVQRQINRNNVFEIRYVGTRGRDLFQNVLLNPRIDRLLNGFTAGGVTYPGFPNLIPAGLTPLTCVNNPATPDNEAACQGRILRAGRILQRQNTGRSAYDSLQTRYNGRLWNSLSLGLAYTFSKTLDNASEIFAFSENSANPQNPFDIDEGEYGRSALDRPHAFSMNFIYDLPFHREQRGFVGHLLGGWQLNSTYVITSGRPYTPVQLWNAAFVGGFGGGTYLFDTAESFRPFLGNINAPRGTVGINQLDAARFFGTDVTNPNGFFNYPELFNNGNVVDVTPNDVRYIINAPGSARFFGTPFGTTPRNIERAKKLNQLNLGIFKNTKLTETITVQFRTEIYNLLNHPNPGYGVAATSDTLPPIYVDEADGRFADETQQEFGRRVIQFGLRFIF